MINSIKCSKKMFEFGKIKSGKKDGNGRPVKLDEFLITKLITGKDKNFVENDEIMNKIKEITGQKKITKIPVYLLFDEVEKNFKSCRGIWDENNHPICIGDGEIGNYTLEDGTTKEKKCLTCVNNKKDKYGQCTCKFHAWLFVGIEADTAFGHVYVHRTTGINSIMNITNILEYYKQISPNGNIAYIPFELELIPAKQKTGKKFEFQTVTISFNGTPKEFLIKSKEMFELTQRTTSEIDIDFEEDEKEIDFETEFDEEIEFEERKNEEFKTDDEEQTFLYITKSALLTDIQKEHLLNQFRDGTKDILKVAILTENENKKNTKKEKAIENVTKIEQKQVETIKEKTETKKEKDLEEMKLFNDVLDKLEQKSKAAKEKNVNYNKDHMIRNIQTYIKTINYTNPTEFLVNYIEDNYYKYQNIVEEKEEVKEENQYTIEEFKTEIEKNNLSSIWVSRLLKMFEEDQEKAKIKLKEIVGE